MPFGLTSAPRIFQRAMDDILREQAGKTCHVYMDDIIIFSKIIEQHFEDLIVIINILLNANMKISIEKSKLFKLETTFLGYVVSHNVIKTDKNKEERYSRVPRLSDTRYSAKWRYASSKARLKCATYRRYTDLSVMGVRVGVLVDETNTFQLKFFI